MYYNRAQTAKITKIVLAKSNITALEPLFKWPKTCVKVPVRGTYRPDGGYVRVQNGAVSWHTYC